MAEMILQTSIPRQKGYLYFCGTDKDGYIIVCKAVMARGRKKKEGK